MQDRTRRDSVERYVRHYNIERYRQLLQSGELDQVRRQAILTLLAQEEAKQAAKQAEPDNGGH